MVRGYTPASVSLEHVAQGQTRFGVPGVAPDPRGVLLGRYLLLAFPTLEAVISWFRLYSAEASLDELMAGLELVRGRSPLASRDLLLRIPAVSSYTCDRAAALAKMVGGAAYTGTAKHFVKYRDDRSPFGYDAVDIASAPSQADIVLHGDGFVQTYTREDALPFDRLLFRLSLRPLPGGVRAAARDRGELLIAVAPGLADGVVRYLWRNRVAAQATMVRPTATGTFSDERRTAYLLIKVTALPERMVRLFVGVPGIHLFRPTSTVTAVAVGYAHPIDLGSCASIFAADQFVLFWPGDRVDALPGPLTLSDIAHVVRIGVDVEGSRLDEGIALQATVDPAAISLPLELVPAMGARRRVTATLVAHAHAAWLKRLVFLLPPTSLRGHRIAATSRGLLLVGSGNIDIIPLGELLYEAAPGLYVPLGREVTPRVSAEVLARALGHGQGRITVLADPDPFQIPETALVPLERRAIAALTVEAADIRDVAAPIPGEPNVVNDPIGQFALWGFPAPADGQGST